MCGLTPDFTINTNNVALKIEVNLFSELNAINAMITTANPPTKIPVNGTLNACIMPPSAHSDNAHKAVSLVIIAEVFFGGILF